MFLAAIGLGVASAVTATSSVAVYQIGGKEKGLARAISQFGYYAKQSEKIINKENMRQLKPALK